MANGKSVEQIQNATLSMFNSDKDKTTSYVIDELAKTAAKNKAFKEKLNGLTPDEFAKRKMNDAIARSIQNREIENQKNYELAKRFDYHPFVNTFYSLFDENVIDMNPTTLESIPSKLKKLTIWDADNTTVEIKKARLVKHYLQITVEITYRKTIFIPAEDFATSKQSIESFRVETATEKIKCAYGKTIDFRRMATPMLNSIVSKYGIANTTEKQTESNNNSWNF